MAKGASSKELIFKKMLEVFDGAFMADAKTLRIPMLEDGDTVEVKVTLTAAKDILGGGNSPSTTVEVTAANSGDVGSPVNDSFSVTEEEKAKVAALLASL